MHGGFVNWTYERLGIFSFTNELWTNPPYFYGKEGDRTGRTHSEKFDQHLTFSEYARRFKPHANLTPGEVLIGGSSKYSSRIPPPFMLEKLCHRNFAFTVYHADQMPKLEWGRVEVKPLLRADLWQVTAEIRNVRTIPSTSRLAHEKNVGERNHAECIAAPTAEGGESSPRARVAASGTLNS